MEGISNTYFATDYAKSACELIGIQREAKAPVPPQLEEMTQQMAVGRDEACLLSSYFLFDFNFFYFVQVTGVVVVVAVAVPQW